MTVDDPRLRDVDHAVRQAAVVRLAPRAAEPEVRDALEACLGDADLAVVKVATAALVPRGGEDGLRRVLRGYARCEDNGVYAIDAAVTECCWSDPGIEASLRATAIEQPASEVSRAAAEIVADLGSDSRPSA